MSTLPCTPENVSALCEKMGFFPDQSVVVPLTGYLALVMKWNKVMNLVGPTQWEDVLQTLVIDSFHLASFVPALPLPKEPECWDLGSGAGLPGVPLRLLWKQGKYTLVEAREKRALFLQTVLAPGSLKATPVCACEFPEAEDAPLIGVHVFRGRAEDFMPDNAPADLIISRAFMPWEKMLAFISEYVKPGGFCVFLTLNPPPVAPGNGWTTVAHTHYAVQNDTRYLWAFRRG